MRESLKLMGEGKINPAIMITHVGGLDSVVDTTLNLPRIPGGKKLIYTNISMPLIALSELDDLGRKMHFMPDLMKLFQKTIISGLLKQRNICWQMQNQSKYSVIFFVTLCLLCSVY